MGELLETALGPLSVTGALLCLCQVCMSQGGAPKNWLYCLALSSFRYFSEALHRLSETLTAFYAADAAAAGGRSNATTSVQQHQQERLLQQQQQLLLEEQHQGEQQEGGRPCFRAPTTAVDLLLSFLGAQNDTPQYAEIYRDVLAAACGIISNKQQQQPQQQQQQPPQQPQQQQQQQQQQQPQKQPQEQQQQQQQQQAQLEQHQGEGIPKEEESARLQAQGGPLTPQGAHSEHLRGGQAAVAADMLQCMHLAAVSLLSFLGLQASKKTGL